jgi:hypothetical protein
MAISERETVLSSRVFSGFDKTEEARLVRRSGALAAKIRIAVSRSSRT